MPTRSITLFVLSLSLNATLSGQNRVSSTAPKPPDTPAHAVTDEYFGTKIVDSYRWLEDLKSPEVSAWMKAQNDYTRSVLDRVAGREKLRARIAQLDDTGVRVSSFQSYGGRWFYLKRAPGQDNQKLYTRDGSNGAELTPAGSGNSHCQRRALLDRLLHTFARRKTRCHWHLARRLRGQRSART